MGHPVDNLELTTNDDFYKETNLQYVYIDSKIYAESQFRKLGFSVLVFPLVYKQIKILTLFEARQGQFDPQHHTYVCSFYSNRARLTKIGDIASLTI